MSKEDVYKYAEEELKMDADYFRIQSVSAQDKGIKEAIDYLSTLFRQLGADEIKIYSEYRNPAIYAFFKGNSNKTLLFYNHYDVQPEDPIDEWQTDPFEPTYKDGKLFVRGICDDKGELVSRFSAVRYYKENGGLPCNVKFMIEGEEEIGSPDIEKYVQAAEGDLTCDALVWEGGGKDEDDNFQIIAGTKGITSFDIDVNTATSDAHSSLAAYMDNAAWRLVQGLASLYGPDRQIKVEHFYDGVEPLSDYTKKQIDLLEQRFNASTVVKTFGISNRKLPVENPLYAVMNEPTITINGLSSGYEEEGVKTVIPRYAKAKLDCRLVPGQNPRKIIHYIQEQLNRNGFGDLQVHFNLSEDAHRTSLENEFVQQNYGVAQKMFGDQVSLIPNQPGAGPMKVFYNHLQVPIVGFGTRYSGSTPHAPNENIRISDFKEGTYYLVSLIEKFSEESTK